MFLIPQKQLFLKSSNLIFKFQTKKEKNKSENYKFIYLKHG